MNKMNENLDLVNEASKSSEYTQRLLDSQHRSSIGAGGSQAYPHGIRTNSSYSRQSQHKNLTGSKRLSSMQQSQYVNQAI